MSNLDTISAIDHIDVLTIPVPLKFSYISNRKRKLKWIIFSTIVILIILAIIIPITIIFTRETQMIATTPTTTITITVSTTTASTTMQPPLHFTKISVNAIWSENGTTVAGSDSSGSQLNQFLHPESIYIDDDQTIYVTDGGNNRIIVWKNDASSGEIVAGANGKGNQTNQLNDPTDVIIDKVTNSLIICDAGNKRVIRWSLKNGTDGQIIISNITCYGLATDKIGYLYVSDHERHEVSRWQVGNTSGIVVAGGNGQGNRSDQLHFPTNIFVDQNQSVYVSDWKNHRVSKWIKNAKEGIVVAGGQGEGKSFEQLSKPRGIVVDQFNTVYIADTDNHRIMRWFESAEEGNIIVGGHGVGTKPNQLYEPIDLSFDQQGNLYVSERENHRVQRFDINLNVTL